MLISRDALLSSGKLKNIFTEIIAATTFYPAEEYHQNYYRRSCGRDARLLEIWGKKVSATIFVWLGGALNRKLWTGVENQGARKLALRQYWHAPAFPVRRGGRPKTVERAKQMSAATCAGARESANLD